MMWKESKLSQATVKIIKANEDVSIKKGVNSNKIENDDIWIYPEIEMLGFKDFVQHSTILPQCISAYKNNIAGFGIGVRYKDDIKETEEMKQEFDRLEEILDLLNIDKATKTVFEDIVEAREMFGIAYLEVIRNLKGEVCEIQFIEDTETVRKTPPLSPSIATNYYYKNKLITRNKKFCKYKQEKNGKTVFFKEFGDKRIMNKVTGEFADTLPLDEQSTEILEFKIGTTDYGTIRWIGQTLNIDGSRSAENLNNNYFREGRHTPLMLVVKGGTLKESSFTKLQEYMDGIKGENGQHAFLILEVEDDEDRAGFEDSKKVDIEVKDMASILQKDELFQDYLSNSRMKVQSAFRLPDLYVGYTKDFNRATSQTAVELTEQQVFIPERKALAYIINNKLLNEYGFKHVEAYFIAPEVSNTDDVVSLLNIAEKGGGLTPNVAREVAFKALGKDSEDYTEDWGNTPIAVLNTQKISNQIDGLISKAKSNSDDEIYLIMKEIKRLLELKEESS